MKTLTELKKQLNNTQNYWENRTIDIKIDSIEKEEAYFKELDRVYGHITSKLDNELERVYSKYAKNNKMTNTEAYQYLNGEEMKKFRFDIAKYASQAQQGGDEAWKAKLLNESLKNKFTRIQALKSEWGHIVHELTPQDNMEKFLNKVYQNTKYKSQFMYEDVGIGGSFNRVDSNRIDMLLRNKFDGANFSDRVWRNREQLTLALDDILTTGFASGESMDSMSRKLAKRMDTELYKAKRLVRTEASRINTQALYDNMKASGVTQFLFTATLDDRTSEICASTDGQIFRMEDAEVGVNMPPLHPNCRSTIVPYFEDIKESERIYRDENGINHNGVYQDYASWLENEIGDREKANAIRNNSVSVATLNKALMTPLPEILQVSGEFKLSDTPTALSEEESEAMQAYQTDKGHELNNALRDDSLLSVEQKQLMHNMDSALEKLAIYQRDTIKSMYLTQDQLEEFTQNHTVGNIVQYKQYLKTQMKKEIAKDKNVVLLIQGKSGRDIRKYNPTDKEILFKRGSKFHVQYMTQEEGILYVYMKEVLL